MTSEKQIDALLHKAESLGVRLQVLEMVVKLKSTTQHQGKRMIDIYEMAYKIVTTSKHTI